LWQRGGGGGCEKGTVRIAGLATREQKSHGEMVPKRSYSGSGESESRPCWAQNPKTSRVMQDICDMPYADHTDNERIDQSPVNLVPLTIEKDSICVTFVLGAGWRSVGCYHAKGQ